MLTLIVQLFLTGRIVRCLGVGVTLALLPGFSILGFGALAALPTLAAVVPFQVLRRAGNFAIARPTREVLFTVLSREDRYKAKSFIDTVVYRLGDQVGAWSFTLLGRAGLGDAERARGDPALGGLAGERAVARATAGGDGAATGGHATGGRADGTIRIGPRQHAL